MKEWIKQREALNYSALAKLVNWSPMSFHQWMKGIRPIPKAKEAALREVLKDYGFKE